MVINPITSETELNIACQTLIATHELERVVEYFMKQSWDKAIVIKDEKALVREQKIVTNYRELFNLIQAAANKSLPKSKLNF